MKTQRLCLELACCLPSPFINYWLPGRKLSYLKCQPVELRKRIWDRHSTGKRCINHRMLMFYSYKSEEDQRLRINYWDRPRRSLPYQFQNFPSLHCPWHSMILAVLCLRCSCRLLQLLGISAGLVLGRWHSKYLWIEFPWCQNLGCIILQAKYCLIAWPSNCAWTSYSESVSPRNRDRQFRWWIKLQNWISCQYQGIPRCNRAFALGSPTALAIP